MKLTILLISITLFSAHAKSVAQTVTVSGKNLTLPEVFASIKKQTGYVVFYNERDLAGTSSVTLSVTDLPLREFLETIFKDQPLSFIIRDKTIVLSRKKTGTSSIAITGLGSRTQDDLHDVVGKVVDTMTKAVQGASVRLKPGNLGSSTKADGSFEIRNVPAGTYTLEISCVGFETYKRKITVSRDADLAIPEAIVLISAATRMDEIVVTGLYERRKESYTGAATTFTKKELTRASASSVFNALRSLDPSFQMPDNLQAGSNPNARQEVLLRGGNSLGDLGGNNVADVFNYTKSPNMPLFILDGFEVNQQRIADLDINRIKTVTLLKDASATSIYGSRAANGVVVVETIRPERGKLRVTYTGSVVNEFADLKGYDLLNAREKLELEKDGGVFSGGGFAQIPQVVEEQKILYSARRAMVEKGNNTDWKTIPVRNGIGFNNNLYLEGGNDAVTYGLTGVYNYTAGAMKGSDRRNISGNSFLSYRVKNLLFRNDFTINSTVANNSPYGNYSTYVHLNPYWSPYDEQGNYTMYLESVNGVDGAYISSKLNPLYDLRLKTINRSRAQNFVNNFFVQWQMLNWLRLSGRLAYTQGSNEADVFLPGTHSSFANIDPDRFFERGSYTKSYGKSSTIDGSLSLDLNKTFGKNIFYATAGTTIRQEKLFTETFKLIGFPNDRLDNILQGQYPRNGEKPSGLDGLNRLLGYFSNVSYVYDQRFLVDLSYRLDGSSQFGSDKRFAPFWSAGAGWNLHNEAFLKANKNIRQLKFRYSYGYTGSSNFASYLGLTTSKYYDKQEYLYQIGTYLMGFGNSSLRWQQTLKQNLGVDFSLFDRIQGSVDVFNEKTKGAVISVTTAPSTGFSVYMDNLGDVISKGYEMRLTYTILNRPQTRDNWTVFATGMHVENKIQRISNALEELNKRNADSMSISPLPRYAEGQSTTAIWAVPSLGIDPSTGREIFVNRNGQKVSGYNPTSQVIVADTRPKLQGTFGTNLEIRGIGLNLFFEYRFGGYTYNQTLAARVENADIRENVDRRVYEDRWRRPGDHTFFKGIVDINGNTVTETTYNTSRFVQRDNWMSLRNASLYYRFTNKLNQSLGLRDTRVTLFAGQLFWLSSIRQERGIDYPFARSFTLQLNTTFN